jgi:uroporphyrinogen decarboxylase
MNLRTDKLTRDERWIAMLNRQPLDRIPIFAFAHGFSAIYCGLPIADVYNTPEKTQDTVNRTAAVFGWQDLPVIPYGAMGAWEFGGEIKWPSSEFSQAPMIVRRPLETEEDVENLKVPEVETAGIVPLMMEVSKLEYKRGAVLIMFHVMGPWGMATNIASIETLLRWVIKKPGLVHKLVQKILPFSIEVIRYWVDTFGADRVMPWVSGTAAASNGLISPETVEEFVLPYQKQLCREIRAMDIKHIFGHICGEQNLNLPYWSQLDFGDPGIVSFDHEVAIETASKYFPNHIIMGNVNSTIIQSGRAEEVYEATVKVIEQGKKCPGGFMLAPNCDLPPRAPLENVWAMMQAVSDFGWYV